jgi:hypothetical protein
MRTFKEYIKSLYETTYPDVGGVVDGELVDQDRIFSDMDTFKEMLHAKEVPDGINVVEPFVFMVKNGKAEIQRDLNAVFDYKANVYHIVQRELPPETMEDRTYVHSTDADIPSLADLRPGKSYGNFGQNEFKAIYAAQHGTHYAHDERGRPHWGKNSHIGKLAHGTKIAKTRKEIADAWAKHPEMSKQQALEAEGYHGVAKIDQRGDVWELALFQNRLTPV